MTTEQGNEKIAIQDEMEVVMRGVGIVIEEEVIVTIVAWRGETHGAKSTIVHLEGTEIYSQIVWIEEWADAMVGVMAGGIEGYLEATAMNLLSKLEGRVRHHHPRRKSLLRI